MASIFCIAVWCPKQVKQILELSASMLRISEIPRTLHYSYYCPLPFRKFSISQAIDPMSHLQIPGWDHLVSHASSCTNLKCGCHLYGSQWPNWRRQLTVPSEDGQVETWLWHTIRDGEFKWMCLVCDGDDNHCLENRGACKISNIS